MLVKVLVSGFEPFLDEKVNPTEQLVHFANSCDFHQSGLSDLDVRGVVLPVVFGEAFERLEAERRLFRPDVVLSFGLAGGRSRFDVEMLAVNSRGGEQTGRGDNRGQVLNGKILESSEARPTLPTTLPVERLLAGLEAAAVPAGRSWSAGTYVCNDLFYRLQDRLRFTRTRSGFIHVPRLDEAQFPWTTFEKALVAILRAL